MKTPSASRFYYEFTVCSANLPWIHYLLHDFTMNSISISRFHYLFRESIFSTLSVSRYLFIHYSIAICFVNSLYIRNQFRGFSLNQLLFPRINSEFIIYFANPIWIWSLLANLLRIMTRLNSEKPFFPVDIFWVPDSINDAESNDIKILTWFPGNSILEILIKIA